MISLEIDMNNYFLLTGGPGAGKTTVLERLKTRGYPVVAEVARQIIQQQNAMGGDKTHTGDRLGFCRLMLEASIHDHQQCQHVNGPVFFDRGIPDLLGYANMINLESEQSIIDATQHYRYNPQVFIFPPWEAIYCNDSQRQQDFNEAVDTYYYLKAAYDRSGYTCLVVPQSSPERRVQFILEHVPK